MVPRYLAWRRLMPWVSLDTELIGIVKQPLHIFAIELPIVRIVKIRPDVKSKGRDQGTRANARDEPELGSSPIDAPSRQESRRKCTGVATARNCQQICLVEARNAIVLCFSPARSNRSWPRPSRWRKRLMFCVTWLRGRPFGRVVLRS